MGICKCKKRTDLFCFIHKKAVCDHCISSDHKVCVVKSYVDWLTDSDYEAPVCGICKGELTQDNVVRFLCLDMFHPECIDVYASSLPAHTAQAGYVCPTCSKPMIPPENSTSPLAEDIRKTFASSSWASNMLPEPRYHNSQKNETQDTEELSTKDSRSDSIEDLNPAPTPASLNTYPAANNTDSTNNSTTVNPPAIHPYYSQSSSTQSSSQPAYMNQLSPTYGIASRKPQQRPYNLPLDDEDEDKYRRKGIMQLFAALGLVSKGGAAEGKRGARLDPKRLLLMFALLASFATIVVLYMLVAGSDPITTTMDDNNS